VKANREPTLRISTAEVENLAKTRALEREAAEAAKTQIWDEVDQETAKGKKPAFALPEPYEDRGEIGRGGMGFVRRVFDNDLQRQVAIKAILPALMKKKSISQRFLDESRITALIDHPNITPVHRLAKGKDGSLSLVMKLIEGRTFSSYLAELPPPPWPSSILDSILGIFGKICDAVAFAHSRGVIHLDLKPDNIMLGSFGQVYVVDWGVARYQPGPDQPALLKTMAPSNASTGTPTYMSPEQALQNNAQINELTDVFLLGGMLYEILTSQKPHGGKTLVEVMTAAIRCTIKSPGERAPGRAIPPALAAIAMKAMAARPQDRYHSVLDLQHDVLAFQRGEERAPRRKYKAGDIVVREGDAAEEAFAIVSGRCVVTSMSHGERVVLRELGPGDVFGETAVFSDEPRSATVEATEPLVVRVVTRETLTQSLGLQTWTAEFIKTLAERFREADRRARDLDESKRPKP
jgi:serine/threonine-protein kinase